MSIPAIWLCARLGHRQSLRAYLAEPHVSPDQRHAADQSGLRDEEFLVDRANGSERIRCEGHGQQRISGL